MSWRSGVNAARLKGPQAPDGLAPQLGIRWKLQRPGCISKMSAGFAGGLPKSRTVRKVLNLLADLLSPRNTTAGR